MPLSLVELAAVVCVIEQEISDPARWISSRQSYDGITLVCIDNLRESSVERKYLVRSSSLSLRVHVCLYIMTWAVLEASHDYCTYHTTPDELITSDTFRLAPGKKRPVSGCNLYTSIKMNKERAQRAAGKSNVWARFRHCRPCDALHAA